MQTSQLHKILEPITRQQHRLSLFRRLTAVWGLAALLMLLFLVGRATGTVSIPHLYWIVPSLAVLTGIAVFIHWKRNPIDVRAAAHTIEKEHPELNSALLAAVEQEPDPKTGSYNILQRRVIARALENNTGTPWHTPWLEKLFVAQMTHLLAFAVMVLLAVLNFQRPSDSGEVVWFQNSVKVVPGDTEVEKGSTLVVMARFPEPVPADATLVVTDSGGSSRRIPMKRNLDDPEYGAQIANVQNALVYRVETDNEDTRNFNVGVFTHPELEQADAQLDFPEYTGLEDKTIQDTLRVTAVEGTGLNYQFRLNKPVKEARLVPTEGESIDLISDSNSRNLVAANWNLATSQDFKLELIDDDGRKNRTPRRVIVNVVTNQPPTMTFKFPRGDISVSALQEIDFEAELMDDFGLLKHGITYQFNNGEPVSVELGEGGKRFEKQTVQHRLALESLDAEPDQLLVYYLWAEDHGPDGSIRRNFGDLYFAEVRPFDEIFREGMGGMSGGQQQQGGQQQGGQSGEILEIQKEILTAAWNIQRSERANRLSEQFTENVTVVRDSQQELIGRVEEAQGRIQDPRMQILIQNAAEEMKRAESRFSDAIAPPSLDSLEAAIEPAQLAYQHLLRLREREFQVTQGQQQGQSSSQSSRRQMQLDQLELTQDEERYASERQASSPMSQAQNESLQVLNRLKDLARRQNDLNEKLKELQTALQAAETQEEKDELERELKRLEEEQRRLMADADELQQRMDSDQNRTEMAESREQLEQTREEMRESAENLQEGQASQALASGTRAQRELQEMRDEFQREASSQFSEDLRQLRLQAQELDRQQEELDRQMAGQNESSQRSLRETDDKEELMNALSQQRERLTNILNQVRTLSEASEIAEPLLSRELYDQYRQAVRGQNLQQELTEQVYDAFRFLSESEASDLENTFTVSRELLERDLKPWAHEVEKRSIEPVQQLAQGVEAAADRILGDDLEALRTAGRELDELAEQLAQESRRRGGNQPGTSPGQTNDAPATASAQAGRAGQNQEGGEQQLAQAQSQSGSQPGFQQGRQESQQEGSSQSGQSQNQGQGQQQNDQQQAGQSGQQGDSQSPSNNPGQQQASNSQSQQPGQSSQPGQQGGGGGPGQQDSQQAQSQTGQGQQANQEGQRNQGGYSLAQDGGTQRGGPNGGSGEWEDPLTGEGYGPWSDRLRNVEEMIDDPEMRLEVARIRDRAREVRMDYRRNAEDPQWDLVNLEILAPLKAVEQWVAEELVRRNPEKNLIALDRDPVPDRFSEVVQQYYENLGKAD